MKRPKPYNKHFTYKSVKNLFMVKYPEGAIFKEINNDNNGGTLQGVYNVSYNKSGKVYTYRVNNNFDLIIKLELSESIKSDYETYMIKYNKDYETYTKELIANDKFGLFATIK